MIRMAYLDSKDLLTRITEDYVRLMNTRTLREHWREIKNNYPELAGFNFSIKQLLSSPFGELIKMANTFDKALANAGATRRKQIKDALKTSVFKYDTYYQRHKIVPFFMKHAEELGLYVCHYCGMAYINVYEYVNHANGKKSKATHFDLDHVIAKADYPILSFSLFNLVPCCPICNERIKGSASLANSSRTLRKFSPTCQDFLFDQKVKMELLPLGIIKRPFLDHPNQYELDFDCHKDEDYEKYITLFRLKERYNYHKSEALRLKDLQMRYPDTNIVDIASLIHVSFDEVKEDIFGLRYSEDHHRCFGKLRRDMLK